MKRMLAWLGESFVPLLAIFIACGLLLVWAQIETQRRLAREVVIQVSTTQSDAGVDDPALALRLLTPMAWQPAVSTLATPERALRSLRDAVRQEPDRAGHWSELVAVHLGRAEPDVARGLERQIAAARDLTVATPGRAAAIAKAFAVESPDDRAALTALLYNLGLAHVQLDELQAAQRALSAADSVGATDWRVALALGLVNGRLSRVAAADRALQQAVERAPPDARARVSHAVGTLYLHSGKPERAAAAFRGAERADSTYIPAKLSLARLAASEGHADQAERLYEEILAKDPYDADAYHQLGILLDEGGRELDAIHHYRRAVVYRPSFAAVRRRLGGLLLRRGRLDEAARHFAWLRTHFPDAAEYPFALGRVCWRQARLNDARVLLREAIEKRNGDYPEALIQLGMVHKDAGNFQAAERAYLAAIKRRPASAVAHHRLGRLYAVTRRHRKAADAYKRALQSDDRNLEVWRDLARCWTVVGRPADAIAAYRNVIADQPDDAQTLTRLAELLARRGDHEEAAELYRRAVGLGVNDAETWLRLGKTLQQLLDTPGAFEAYGNAVRLASSDGGRATRVEAYRAIALLHQYRHEYSDALDSYRRVILHAPKDTDARYGIAASLLELGDREAASLEISKLLAIDGRHRKALQLALQLAQGRDDPAAETAAPARLQQVSASKPRARPVDVMAASDR